jgi:hypothetical protein
VRASDTGATIHDSHPRSEHFWPHGSREQPTGVSRQSPCLASSSAALRIPGKSRKSHLGFYDGMEPKYLGSAIDIMGREPTPPPVWGTLLARAMIWPPYYRSKSQQWAARQSGHRVPSTPMDALLIVRWVRWPPFPTDLSSGRQPGYHACGRAIGDPQERVNIGLSGVQPNQLAQPPASMPSSPGTEVP